MWYNCVDNNKFLLSLYESVPMLVDIQITKLSISDSGNRITIVFKMPYYPDFQPKKWKQRGYNSVVVELDFFAISELKISSNANYYIGNIEIKKGKNEMINIVIEGNIEVKFNAEAGIIQSIEGYILGN